MWDVIPYVTAPVTLAAFVAAVGAWAFWNSLGKTERLIKTALPDKRDKLVDKALESFNIDPKDLSKPAREALALEQLHARSRQYLIAAVVVTLIALMASIVLIVAIVNASDSTRAKLRRIEHVEAQLVSLLRGVENAAGAADASRNKGPEINRLANQLRELLEEFDKSNLQLHLSVEDSARLKSAHATLTEAAIVTAQVTFTFSGYESLTDIPDGTVFDDGCELIIAARPKSQPGSAAMEGGWTNDIMMSNPGTTLTSTVQDVSRQTDGTTAGVSVRQTNTFFHFVGTRGSVATTAEWTNAEIEAVLRCRDLNPWLRTAAGDVRQFDKFYGISPELRTRWADSDYSVDPRFPATLILFVNGEQIATLKGIVARVSEHDEDARNLYVTRFLRLPPETH